MTVVAAATRRARVESREQTWENLPVIFLDQVSQYLTVAQVIKLTLISRHYFIFALRREFPGRLSFSLKSLPDSDFLTSIRNTQDNINETLNSVATCCSYILPNLLPARFPSALQAVAHYFASFPSGNSMLLVAAITKSSDPAMFPCKRTCGNVEDTLLKLIQITRIIDTAAILTAFVEGSCLILKRFLAVAPQEIKTKSLKCVFLSLPGLLSNGMCGFTEKMEKIQICIEQGAEPPPDLLLTISKTKNPASPFAFLLIAPLIHLCVARGHRLTEEMLVNFRQNFAISESDWPTVRDVFASHGAVIT